jgi:hypothetical protein
MCQPSASCGTVIVLGTPSSRRDQSTGPVDGTSRRDQSTGPVDGTSRRDQSTGPVDADVPKLGEHQHPVRQPRAVAILLETERMVAVLALEAREARFLAPFEPAEEGLIGLVEPREHILQHVAVDGGVLGKRGADILEFGVLREPRDGDRAALPGGDTLLQRRVGERAAAHEDALKLPLLGGRGPELRLVGFMAGRLVHILVFRPGSAKTAMQTTSGSSLEAPHRLG